MVDNGDNQTVFDKMALGRENGTTRMGDDDAVADVLSWQLPFPSPANDNVDGGGDGGSDKGNELQSRLFN